MTRDEMLEAAKDVTNAIRAQSRDAVELAHTTSVGQADWRPLVLALDALVEAVLFVGEAAATSAAIAMTPEEES